MCHAPCQRTVLPHCPPCPLVPASMQVCGEEHGSTCRELFLPFTVCYVTKTAFQPQGRQILVQSGCPAVNHCQSCAGGGVIHAGCFIKQHRQGVDSGAFPLGCTAQDASCHPWWEKLWMPMGCCLLPALAAPSLLLCGAKQRLEALQSAS